jgi:hypothetical protein
MCQNLKRGITRLKQRALNSQTEAGAEQTQCRKTPSTKVEHRLSCATQTKSNRAKRSLASIITIPATCPEKPWIAANLSLSNGRMLTG